MAQNYNAPAGLLPITFQINEHQTNQPLFICNKIDRLCFSKQGCIDLNICPSTFHYPMSTTALQTSAACAISNQSNNTENPPTDHPFTTPNIPTRPTSLSFSPTTNKIPKLEKYSKTQFASLAFNRGPLSHK